MFHPEVTKNVWFMKKFDQETRYFLGKFNILKKNSEKVVSSGFKLFLHTPSLEFEQIKIQSWNPFIHYLQTPTVYVRSTVKHDSTMKHDTSQRKQMESIGKLDYVLKPILSDQTLECGDVQSTS